MSPSGIERDTVESLNQQNILTGRFYQLDGSGVQLCNEANLMATMLVI
ncbi:MAG: hypothetical protein V1791_14380 [Pseudomonadota bacterium]